MSPGKDNKPCGVKSGCPLVASDLWDPTHFLLPPGFWGECYLGSCTARQLGTVPWKQDTTVSSRYEWPAVK